MYRETSGSTELWAVVMSDGRIAYSRGGSSSTPKLMVYAKEHTAKKALKSPWIRQVIDPDSVEVKRIYPASK